MNRRMFAFPVLATAALAGSYLAGVNTPYATAAPSLPSGQTTVHVKHVNPPDRARWMKRPCAEEDSVNCTWNADLLGDGVGHSFYSVQRDGIRCIFYVKRADAKRWDDCTVTTPARSKGGE